jgi:hypothetical protein
MLTEGLPDALNVTHEWAPPRGLSIQRWKQVAVQGRMLLSLTPVLGRDIEGIEQ